MQCRVRRRKEKCIECCIDLLFVSLILRLEEKRLFLFINSGLIGVGYDVSLFVFIDILAFEIAVQTERQTKGQTFENQTRDKLVQSVVGRVVVVKRRRP